MLNVLLCIEILSKTGVAKNEKSESKEVLTTIWIILVQPSLDFFLVFLMIDRAKVLVFDLHFVLFGLHNLVLKSLY